MGQSWYWLRESPTLQQKIKDAVDYSSRDLADVLLTVMQRHVMQYRFELLELSKKGCELSYHGPCPKCGGMVLIAPKDMINGRYQGYGLRCYDCGWDPLGGGVYGRTKSKHRRKRSFRSFKRIKAARSGTKTVSRKVVT